ncbi:type II secretion system ATPase GspE [Motiliproteus sp. MSK22-1]|uniref:type II secretion system ATPase GspE n=1 Tax=Motiliproteus sp. MSK22-1 TaxID=1897630 RepID=UPI0009F86294|nr:type II secretion system ATPase GspE [Motiliproteus sp. MSK22-1]
MPFSFANKFQLFASAEDEQRMQLHITENTPLTAIAEVRRYYGVELELKLVDSEQFQLMLAAAYQQNSQANMVLMEQIGDEVNLFKLVEELPEDDDLLEGEDDAPIIKLINALITEAIKEGASDIHIEPYEKSLSVRLRVDGVMREVISPNHKLAALLISRIKVMAKLDIAEKRVPQDGRISVRIAGRALDIRVSTLPSSHGERIVMRLLDKQGSRMGLPQLGMPEIISDRLQQALLKPNGIILVTGPTGSGKTTTLYAGLGLLNERSRNILTIEDPIEYAVEGVGQTQVNSKTGMTFAKGLRAMLRQDPDVMMVGEIRDFETAEIAVQASLTGHLVLSTLHTNNSLGAITRLNDIGVDSYLIATTLRAVLAQRLVRRLCQSCRTPYKLETDEALRLGIAGERYQGHRIFKASENGCDQCNHSGYKGRIGVYELLSVDAGMAELIHNQAAEAEIRAYLSERMTTMIEEARELVFQGMTSAEEVLRIIHE